MLVDGGGGGRGGLCGDDGIDARREELLGAWHPRVRRGAELVETVCEEADGAVAARSVLAQLRSVP